MLKKVDRGDVVVDICIVSSWSPHVIDLMQILLILIQQ